MTHQATVHEPWTSDCTRKELKCEAVTTVVVTSRRESEIPQAIAGARHFALSDRQGDCVPVYLVCEERKGVSLWAGVTFCDGWSRLGDKQIQYVSIPPSVSELCDDCFKGCKSIRRVTFGPASSLERIGRGCFEDSGVEEVTIPDSVRELCDGCFKVCKSLRRVIFGPASSLEQIGCGCFEDSGV